MRSLVVLSLLCVAALAAPSGGPADDLATPCAPTCQLPNCRCFSSDIPNNLPLDQTPQFVMLTFDDAVTVTNIEFYRNALDNKQNRNQCPVQATYFVSHEYTDYSLVQELYSKGHEIALHSISHITQTEYWKNGTVDLMTKEFGGEQQLISTFANIPINDITGLRMPFLQLAGENSFKMIKNEQMKYDCSWPTQSFMTNGPWPYTLDHRSDQDCPIGPCPKESHTGVWVVPMINWQDQDDVVCAMVDACVNIPNTVDELTQFMIKNFNRQYKSNKAPVGFFVHAAWFTLSPEIHFEAYKKFIDYLLALPDVYLVGVEKVIEWVKNPVPLSEMVNSQWTATCRKPQAAECNPKSCQLIKEETGETRFMTCCSSSCPRVYPWLGNPLGA